MKLHYDGLIKLRTSNQGDLDLIGVDNTTYIACVGRGLEGADWDRAKFDAQRLVNAWNYMYRHNEVDDKTHE